jgi:transcriptional regulator with XRE-family HTH domain
MHPWQHKPKKNASALRLVGAQLSLFRQVARLTQRELAERLVVAEDTIASIEQGRRPLKPDLAEQLDHALDTKGALAVAVANLPEMDKFPVWAAEFIDREREAIAFSSYENQVVPGLLQTESYARAVFRSRVPILSEDEIEQQVASRIERQNLLCRKEPPTASFIIAEAVLRDHLGGEDVFDGQLGHLSELAAFPCLSLQVMPFGRTTLKSSYSGDEGGACLEVAACPTAVHVRDSKDPAGPALTLSPTAWPAFADQVQQGRL